MMRVLSCITAEHDDWIVLLAALVCIAGSWTTIRLFLRTNSTAGLQKSGWHFLTAVGAGSATWCTHFIAMLAYEPGAPVSFDPVLTIVSLLVAIGASALGFLVATSRFGRFMPAIGGALVGLAIAAMHYTGMVAYHIEGLITWNPAYLAASVILAALLTGTSLQVALMHGGQSGKYLAAAVLVGAIVSLHFTGMAAIGVTPLATTGEHTDPAALQAMALAVAAVGLLIVGTGVASYLIDDQSRLESFQRLRHLALNDMLTELPNRISFNEHLDHEIDQAGATGTRLALLCIDLDRFKEINDVRGHSAGDKTLQILAARMSALLRPGEFVARLGGDEFAAVKRVAGQTDLVDFAARLEAALGEPFQIDGTELSAGASIGVAVYPDDAKDKEALTNGADLAMYRAKADPIKSVCFYEQAMDEAARSRRHLASDLRKALEQGELDLHYQVQTAVATGTPIGFEALLRWRHPQRGAISPVEFIPLAEKNGLIQSIGEWALRSACAEAAGWDSQYKVAVNISPVQFVDADLPRLVHQVLVETGLPARRLELEITETAIFADKNRALHMLRRIKSLGVSIAIDDFGTGYSSFETLRAFPFDKIKLDRSFMSEVEASPQARAIIRAILALGRSLDIPVLAEGVETRNQLAFLRAEGCDEAQGFLLGRPIPREALIAAKGRALPAAAPRLPLVGGLQA